MGRVRSGKSQGRRVSMAPVDFNYANEVLSATARGTSANRFDDISSPRLRQHRERRLSLAMTPRVVAISPSAPVALMSTASKLRRRRQSLRRKELFTSLRQRYADDMKDELDDDVFLSTIPTTEEEAHATGAGSVAVKSSASAVSDFYGSPPAAPATHAAPVTATVPDLTISASTAAAAAPITSLMSRLLSVARWPLSVLERATGLRVTYSASIAANAAAEAAAAAAAVTAASATAAAVDMSTVTADTHRIRRLRARVSALEAKLERLEASVTAGARTPVHAHAAPVAACIPPPPMGLFTPAPQANVPPPPAGLFGIFGPGFGAGPSVCDAPVEKTWNLKPRGAPQKSAPAAAERPVITLEALRSVKLRSAAAARDAPSTPARAAPSTPGGAGLGAIVTLDALRSVRLRKAASRVVVAADADADTPARAALRDRAAKSCGAGMFIPSLRDITGVKLRSTELLRSPGKTPHKPRVKSPEAPSNPIAVLRRRMLGSPGTRAALARHQAARQADPLADADAGVATASEFGSPASRAAAAAAAGAAGTKRARPASPATPASAAGADENENNVVMLSPASTIKSVASKDTPAGSPAVRRAAFAPISANPSSDKHISLSGFSFGAK